MTMKEIESLTPASQLNVPEVPMVTKKQKTAKVSKRAAEADDVPAPKKTKKPAAPKAEVKPEPTNVVAITKKTKSTKKTEPVAPPAPEPKAEKKQSARELFHGLIMAGQLTDKEILASVAETLGWTPEETEKRKRYVAWYRSELKTVLGKNPPAAKQTA